MEFAVAEYADRAFEEMCAQLRDSPARALRTAAGLRETQLRAEPGSLVVYGPETAMLRVVWRDPVGRPTVEAELRVLGIDRGAEPVTELVMIGHRTADGQERCDVVAWAHGLLAKLADYPRTVGRIAGAERR